MNWFKGRIISLWADKSPIIIVEVCGDLAVFDGHVYNFLITFFLVLSNSIHVLFMDVVCVTMAALRIITKAARI